MPEVAQVFCGVCPSHWQGYSQEIEKKNLSLLIKSYL